MTHWTKLATVVLLALLGSVAQAAAITFSPRFQTVALGDEAQVDIVVSDTAGRYVGAYDFFVEYDPSILALSAVDIGTGLGGPLDSLAEVVPGAGRVNVSEVSLLFDLSALQTGSDPFTLFTLTFQTRLVGVGLLDFQENILGVAGGYLGDELGDVLNVSRTDAGSITVVTAPLPGGQAPEPGTLALAGLALLTARGVRRAARTRHLSR